MEGYDLIWSQRNIDVGEPLQPGVTHEMTFTVGSGDYTEPVTVTLGMVTHKGGLASKPLRGCIREHPTR